MRAEAALKGRPPNEATSEGSRRSAEEPPPSTDRASRPRRETFVLPSPSCGSSTANGRRTGRMA
eukprot:10962012-Alexandrium_andersonii.AAC.1